MAYPTTITDADGFSSMTQYNFDFGGVTRKQTPQPNVTTNTPGPIQTMRYDSHGRLERVTSLFNNAYTRFVYGPNHVESFATVNNVADEVHSIQVFDGAGRIIAAASNHPGSVGGFSGQLTLFDKMGRAIKTSNPTETAVNISGSAIQPYNWTAAGDDASAGWLYTQQTYDWKGRPRVTTNTDGTTKEASYSGCGCAGGEVVTLTDEGTLDGGVVKRRQQKIYSDILGRTVKTEVLNWQGGSVYSTTVNSHNARDQVTLTRAFAGPEGSATYQETTATYDGYGRLKTRHAPEQQTGTATVYSYNPDDTVQLVTDARGAVTSFTYNDRHLLQNISYAVPQGSTINVPAGVIFEYDAVGNRISMLDGSGSTSYQYNQLSQLNSETRAFAGLAGTYTLSYEYTLSGGLKKLTDNTNVSMNYSYDAAGRPGGITGSDTLYADVTNYVSNLKYRAWGGLKEMTDGANKTASLTYNNRLQPSTYTVTGNIVAHSYDYFADGRVQYLHSTNDVHFDRQYFYDHAGRLTENRTGGYARGDVAQMPYWQNFNYDTFSNLTARATDTWNWEHHLEDVASYTNNLRSGWGYDADGRNTNIDTRTITFDASGRQTQITFQAHGLIGPSYTVTQSSSYDGDGVLVREVRTQSNSPGSEQTTRYLRSSVLGGAVIEELNSSGEKIVGYVHTPSGRRFAVQRDGLVYFKHETPEGATELRTYSNNWAPGRVEFDPLGADVALTAPIDPPPDLGPGDLGDGRFGGILDARWGDFFNLSSGCPGGSQAASCSGHMYGRNMDREMRAFFGYRAHDFAGYSNPLMQGEHRYRSVFLNDGYDPQFGRYVRGYLAENGFADLENNTIWVFGGAEYFKVPQNPDTPGITKLVNEAVGKDACAEFARRVLAAVSSKKNPTLEGGDLGKIFQLFLDKGGAFTRTLPAGSAGYGNPIGLIPKGAKIAMSRFSDSSLQMWSDAVTVIDELFHLAGTKAQYDDYQLAKAVHGIPDYAAQMPLSPQNNVFHPNYKGNAKDRYDGGYSSYFHNVARILCPVAKP